MELTSKFAGASKGFSFVTKGTKAVSVAAPVMRVQRTPNKFHLNRIAATKMGLETKGYIHILCNSSAEDINAKFGIVVAPEGDESGAKLAPANSANKDKETKNIDMIFNYSGVWSQMIQCKPEAVEISAAALAEFGLTEPNTTKKGKLNYKAVSTVTCEIGDPETITIGDQDYEMFPLINFKVEDAAVAGEEEEEEEEEEQDQE